MKIDAPTIQYTETPASDTADGVIVTLTAGENVALGDVCYVKSDGKAWKANATDNTKSPALFVALATIAGDATGSFLANGFAKLATLAPSWTVGGLVYLAATDGAMTQSAPATTGNVVQVLGVASAADTIYWKPEMVMVEIA